MDADAVLARMRADRDSDWPQRLQARIDLVADLPLSARELDVLRCASVGLRASDTADLLGIAFHTARNHRASAVLKMRAKNVAHAVALALRAELIA